MASWFERALMKMIAPDETKKLSLNARVKLLDLREGTAVWFTPQEIAAVEQDRHEMKRNRWGFIPAVLLTLGGGWLVGFSLTWVITVTAASAVVIAVEIMTWRKVNGELTTMRGHQTKAHPSFFGE